MTEKNKKLLKYILLILCGILITGAIAGVLYGRHLFSLIGSAQEPVPTLSEEEEKMLLGTTEALETTVPETTVPEEPQPPWTEETKITNSMLVGQNWREDEQNKLSDTMILCSINRETKTMTMVSILRDLYVRLPAYAGHGGGQNRINVCYALGSSWKRDPVGGMEMLALCVEQNFGIHVDHTIEVGFEAFANIVNVLDGLEIEVTEAEANYMTKEIGYVGDIEPGLQKLDGWETLAYARIRKIDNDRQRAVRQRTVITKLVERCRNLDLKSMMDLMEFVLPYVATDMTKEEIVGYIVELLPMLKELKLASLTCPVDNETLPHSMWGKTIDLYGYTSSVIECNTSLNGAYIREQLGITPKETDLAE